MKARTIFILSAALLGAALLLPVGAQVRRELRPSSYMETFLQAVDAETARGILGVTEGGEVVLPDYNANQFTLVDSNLNLKVGVLSTNVQSRLTLTADGALIITTNTVPKTAIAASGANDVVFARELDLELGFSGIYMRIEGDASAPTNVAVVPMLEAQTGIVTPGPLYVTDGLYKTGSGKVVFDTSPELKGTPIIPNFTAANHDHGDTEGGGVLSGYLRNPATAAQDMDGNAITNAGPVSATSVTIGATNVVGELAGKQPLDADLTDLADGELTGSKVGTGINADNITTGTVDEARIDPDMATDGEVAAAVAQWAADPATANVDIGGYQLSSVGGVVPTATNILTVDWQGPWQNTYSSNAAFTVSFTGSPTVNERRYMRITNSATTWFELTIPTSWDKSSQTTTTTLSVKPGVNELVWEYNGSVYLLDFWPAPANVDWPLSLQTASSSSTNFVVDFAGDAMRVINLSGNCHLQHSTNRPAGPGNSVALFITANGADRTLSWNTSWHPAGTGSTQTTITNGTGVRVTVEAWGQYETNVVFAVVPVI